jgi:fructosamine-3-kinase
MIDRLTRAVSAALGSAVVSMSRTRGGDINDAFEALLADGRSVFVKTNTRADPHMFAREARGLDWLREAGAIRVPAVLAFSEGTREDERAREGRGRDAGEARGPDARGPDARGQNDTPFLILERVEFAPRARDFDELLGRQLASLHRFGAPAFGFVESNFIGSLPQDNRPCDTWPDFYVSRRLQPQVRAAIDRGHAPSRWRRDFDRLFARMTDLVGPPEPPARLHGDLWGGNVLADDRGAPCVIDPAVYGGHREVDLAMLRLFGGAGSRCFAAYDEAWPLAEGHADRVPLYQLYPLLTHVNLFGGGYVPSVERALGTYVT